MPATQTSIELVGAMSAKQQFLLLSMSANKRKRFLQWAAREVRKNSRKRLRQQKDLNGKSFTPRKSKSRKKMLKGLSKHLRAFANPSYGMVDFYNAGIGKVAKRHQEGIDQMVTAQQMKQRDKNSEKNEKDATRLQAKRLRVLGFKIRRLKGKGWKRPTIRWVIDNLKQGQAGLIIHVLQGNKRKQSWNISLPARSFLGVNQGELQSLMTAYFSKH